MDEESAEAAAQKVRLGFNPELVQSRLKNMTTGGCHTSQSRLPYFA